MLLLRQNFKWMLKYSCYYYAVEPLCKNNAVSIMMVFNITVVLNIFRYIVALRRMFVVWRCMPLYTFFLCLGSPTTDGRRGSADRESLRSCAYCCRPTSRIWNRSLNPAEPTNALLSHQSEPEHREKFPGNMHLMELVLMVGNSTHMWL